MTSSVRWALDENFPEPIVDALKSSMPPSIELASVREIDPRLESLDDWQLIVALRHRGWDGLITCDSGMLSLPREMCALERTGLTLIVAEAAGHDPILATGLVLAHVQRISQLIEPGAAKIFRLRARTPGPETPSARVNQIASHRKVSVGSLRADNELTQHQLRDPLSK